MSAGVSFYGSLQKETISRWGVGMGVVREDFLEEVVFELHCERCIDFDWNTLRQEHLARGIVGPKGPK